MNILSEIRDRYGEVFLKNKIGFGTKENLYRKEDVNTVAMLLKNENLNKEETDYCYSFLMCAMKVISGRVLTKLEKQAQFYPNVREELESDLFLFIYEALERWKVDYDFQTECIYYFKSKIRRKIKREYSIYTTPSTPNLGTINVLEKHRETIKTKELMKEEDRGKICIDTKIYIHEKYGKEAYYNLINEKGFPKEMSEDEELREVLIQSLTSKNKIESEV